MKVKTPLPYCLAIALWLFNTVDAKPLMEEQVPAPLKPWVDWVSQGNEHKRCPFMYSSFEQFYCAWPDELNLALDGSGGEFRQQWQVYAESWLLLPGDSRYWPSDVTLNGKPALVVSRNGIPAIEVSKGTYAIQGRFKWQGLPESLALPEATALMAVTLNGKAVNFPRVENGRLWMQVIQPQKVEDRFELQVFRRIDDTIPAQVTFYLDMQVAGSARETTLDLPLTAEFIPLRLQSPLPSRLDSNRKLSLQLKPGHWAVELTVRHIGPLSQLTMQPPGGIWVQQEVWVFSAQPRYRIVNVSGVTAIDPQQTLLPDTWKQLPAYRVNAGETMTFNEERRGDPDPGADNLSLQRTLWLSFSGDEYLLQDQISGVKKTDWRMEMNAPIELGQVNMAGEPQYITRLKDSERSGVEVRQGNIQMTADSVLRGDINWLPAVGWNQNFNNVHASLNLPPGYQVFSVTGADHVSATWLTRWTLLDIFLVLLISAAVYKLWGTTLGGIALVTLTLIYHETNAPVWIWLLVILGFALLRVLPSGRFRRWALMYRNITLLALVLICVPFFIQQIRTSLYPQLEHYYQTAVPSVGRTSTEVSRSMLPSSRQQILMPKPMQELAPERTPQQEAQPLAKMKPSYDSLGISTPSGRGDWVSEAEKKSKLELYDPNAILQTGPGLPQWQWNSVAFSWSGPVDSGQKVHITYISPLVSSLLGWLRVLLVTVLILGLLDVRFSKQAGLSFPSFKSFASLVLLSLTATALFVKPEAAQAEFPSKAMLQELQNRLFTPPDCLPNCADAQAMRIAITPNKLTLELTVNANQNVAIPLPGDGKHWSPQSVLVNHQRAQGLIKDQSGVLWLPVTKGRHTVRLEGLLPEVDTLQLPLPLKPHYVTVSNEGWEVAGIHEDGSIDTQLQFTRLARLSQQDGEKTEFNTTTLPPFAQVERTVFLGLDWRVQTSITRLSPTGPAVVLQVPLLPGESVTTEGIQVEKGRVLINMSANQTSAGWQSLISMKDANDRFVDTLQLVAPDTTQWTEVWNLDVSPIWHVQYQGIPVIRHEQGNRWLPQWRPWPGEQVTLTLSRPQGIEGQTTTIDDSRINLNPGIRITNVALSLHLRSSQGAQHPIVLPENSTLQEVRIDNNPIPLRLQDRTLLLPVKPGEQHYDITWQEPRGVTARFATSALDLGTNNVNHTATVSVPRDRVVLFVGGPAMGPAVLFWGVMIVFLVLCIGLAQSRGITPLRYWQWALLSIGLVPVSIESALVVIGWFFVTGLRCRLEADTEKWQFNLYQLVLVGFTLVTAGTLVYAVSRGLLGYPNMQIYGNGSNQYALTWYQDLNSAALPQAWMFTVPMYGYRLLMLLWALWLAFSVIQWSKWFWDCFSSHGYWRSVDWKKKAKTDRQDKTLPATRAADPKYLQGTVSDNTPGSESDH